MKFVELTPKTFRAFAARSPYRSFMQTPEIAKHRADAGWTPHYFAVVEGKRILAATLMVSKPTFLGKSLFLTPGGPLLDLEDTKLATFFLKCLAAYARGHGGYSLQISPYYELTERDRHGEPLATGFHHEKALDNLQALGFRSVARTTQPRYLFALDIKSRTPDQLFADFKSNTRNHIRHAERAGVTVRELGRGELGLLKDITKSTARRRNFTDQPLSYYEQMYDLFVPRGEARFLLAEATIDGRQVPLSAAMFMLVGSEVVYLYSGSDERYMRDYSAQYLIQWEMIRYAAEHGFQRYNFYGISGLPDPSDPGYGIYTFKKGFGGHVVELIGTYELPLRRPTWTLHHVLSSLKHH